MINDTVERWAQELGRLIRHGLVGLGLLAMTPMDAMAEASAAPRETAAEEGEGGRHASSMRHRNLERLERYFGLHILEVLYRELEEHSPIALPASYSVRPLTREEAMLLAADQAMGLSPATVVDAYAHGGGSVGAFHGTRIIGYGWYSFSNTPYEGDAMVEVPTRAVYRYKVFVLPAYRGNHVATKLVVEGGLYMRRADRDFGFALVGLHNRSSLAASRSAGRRRVGRVILWRKGPFFFAWHSKAVRALGIHLYRRSP